MCEWKVILLAVSVIGVSILNNYINILSQVTTFHFLNVIAQIECLLFEKSEPYPEHATIFR